MFTIPDDHTVTLHANPVRVAAFEKATELLTSMNQEEWPTFDQALALANWLLVETPPLSPFRFIGGATP